MACVLQYEAAFRETGNKVTDEVKTIISTKLRGPLSSVIIEEMNGVQKNRGRAKHGSTCFRRPPSAMAQTLQSGLLESKHRFTAVRPDLPVKEKMTRLPREAFEPKAAKRSLAFDAIVSTTSAVDYHSPASNKKCMNIADHQMLEDSKITFGRLAHLDKAWQGALVDGKHNIVVQHRRTDREAFRCFVGVASFESSACLVWPCVAMSVDGYPEQEYFELPGNEATPSMITIFDMRSPNIKACRVRWLAPVNQWQELPGCKATLPVAVRAFRSGPWQGLHEVAAHCAFWQLGRSTLEDICGILGIDVVAGTDLVGLLWTMIQRVTGLPDQGVLEILHQRLANLDISNSYAPEVLCLDEALAVLEESDKRAALEEQRSVPSKVEAHKSFKRSYFAKAKVVRQSAAKAEGRPRKRAKKKQLFRETFEDSFDISQKESGARSPAGRVGTATFAASPALVARSETGRPLVEVRWRTFSFACGTPT